MTLLKVRRDLLMLHPYFSLSPSTLVSFVLSLPAKSTTCILLLRLFLTSYYSNYMLSIIVNIVWDLDDSEFMNVEAVFLTASPLMIILSTYS